MNQRLLASILSCTALLCTATGAAAQSNSFDRVSFSDQPEPAAAPQTSELLEPEAPPVKTTRSAPVGSKRAIAINAAEATRRLEQARLNRTQGVAPLPGERVQTATGSKLNYRYWQRQEKLRLLVEQAQKRWTATNQTQLARQ